MQYRVTVMPQKWNIDADPGANLLDVLRQAGLTPDAPCGGNGTCGKCKVLVEGREVLACKTQVWRDMEVTLPADGGPVSFGEGVTTYPILDNGKWDYRLAFDIGTTTVAGYLLDGVRGQELACESRSNPQAVFGADVVTRIRLALKGQMEVLTIRIRTCVEDLAHSLCKKAGIPAEQIRVISIVANPAMRQLFLGILPENLARIPFAPVLIRMETVSARAYLPGFPQAAVLLLPDISGFVGTDTLAGILFTEIDRKEEMALLVDIGTNGEMVLGNVHRMVACSTAAGPALEGANIRFGMIARRGAIDHVRRMGAQVQCDVIGGGAAQGICGSGLIDAAAVALELDRINSRGRIQNEAREIPLSGEVCLTQEDIRQLQLAKGAIAAGIQLMADHLGVSLGDIQRVYLAGAFGTYLDPASACRIGLLPPELEPKIQAVGNAAGSGAKLLAWDVSVRERAQRVTDRIESLDLASLPGFSRCFADNSRFPDPQTYWIRRAQGMGFQVAVPLDVSTLTPRQDVRDMCQADTCRAYGKNWTCPPHCGTLETCAEKMRGYRRGILLQTVGQLEKTIDTKAYRRTEQVHLERFHRLAEAVRTCYPDALCLGSGGCRICRECAFPQPCRFPERACASMEGYGLFVTQVCRDNGIDYHHGQRTVTYTACVLF